MQYNEILFDYKKEVRYMLNTVNLENTVVSERSQQNARSMIPFI